MYIKRTGSSGSHGQLYVTKLLRLLYFRAIHDDTVQRLQLATNIDKIRAFDDICFKAKVKGYDKPVAVFIQVQHKADKRQTLKIDLPTYFDSYNKIREHFGQIFGGTFNETECLFVIFTNANVDYYDAPTTSGLVAKLNYVLDTGGVVKQPNSEENIEYLTKKIVQNEITSLAEWVVRFIYNKKNFQFILSHELVLRYHVILAQEVFEVSDIQPLESNDAPRYRIASFRQDFFDNTEEYIMLFRETLYLEVIKRRRIEPAEIRLGLSELLGDPTDAIRLSKLIGTVVTYSNGQLEFDKKYTKAFKPNMKPMDVSRSTVNKAVELAAREMLSAVKFRVPAAFGNMDFTLRGSDAKMEKRICYLALKMKDLLNKFESSKVVTIDESSDAGFLQLNGGIAGAVRNIFVLDDNTNLMKITDNCETLGTRAKSVYTKLKSEVHNLHEYKFCFKIYKFPKLSFACSHYEEKTAKDFLEKMLVYSNQADETDLEEIFKNEIADIQSNQPNYFQAKTDLILSRYYDEIRTSWKRAQDASYLTHRINLFRKLIDEIIKEPLMSSINKTYYTSKVKQHDYTFTEDAVRSLNLPDRISNTIIVAGNCLLTVVKVLQHLKSKQVQHVVLDLEYLARLATNDLNALRAELVNTNKDKVLILVCDQKYYMEQTKITKNIAEAVKNKTHIIITDQKSFEILTVHKYLPKADKILYDKKFSLNDVSLDSQRSILESATVVFPGVEIRLQHLLRSWPKTGVTSAGETDTAAVVDVSEKLTAESSRPFGAGREFQSCVRSPSLALGASSSGTMYRKRAGPSGIRGQPYKTMLLRLLYFGVLHNSTIQEFQLAANIDKIGAFHDICFKAKIKRHDKPVTVFIQAQHKADKRQTLKIDLPTYFDSYNKIREHFGQIFGGTFNETECLFVIFTNANVDYYNAPTTSGLATKLNDVLDTGGVVKQPNSEENIKYLTKKIVQDEITSLAEWVVRFIYNKNNFQFILSHELVLRYHVILAQEVFEVSDIQPLESNDAPRYRIASFRQDFFDNTEEYIMLFRETLYLEVIKRRRIEPAEIRLGLSEFLGNPTDAIRLSKLIGTVVTYNNGQLEFDKKSTKGIRPHMKPMDVSRSTVNKAVELAAREMLSAVKLKVPVAFGNMDLTLSGSDASIERRICYLALRLKDLLNKCESSKVITIDESVGATFLQHNGGIAGAVGNLFVLDDNTNMIKITDNCETLGTRAKSVYTKLKSEVHNLHEYKFCFKIYKFPKLSFACSHYEEKTAKDFLEKMLVYSNQADETDLEEIFKNEIAVIQRNQPNYFQAKTDAIFLKYHDEIQEWVDWTRWMRPGQASYLTRENDLFKNVTNNIIKGQLMNSINITYMSKIRKKYYTFTEDAVSALKLQDEHTTTLIITENSALTVVKVLQHLKNKSHVVLDLEYIIKLPVMDRYALRRELTNTSEDNYLIFVCDKILNTQNEKKILENIAQAVHKTKAIIITNDTSLTLVNECFSKADNTVHDENISLIHMSEESQKVILENATVIFQGKEVKLNLIVDDNAKSFVKGDILNTIASDETIVVGKLTVNETYDEIKHLYIDRRIKKPGDDRGTEVKTLKQVSENVVLVTAEPGMGKSTLLTHLSLKTKELEPEVWIVRINLLEYSKEFSKWKQEKTVIDTLETLKFLCQVILREHDGKDNNVEFKIEEDNAVVYLTQCSGDQWTEFELKLFLNLYNKGKMIFLFDGFDEICPHYAEEVIACIKTVSFPHRKHRKWITSRSYNDVTTILQREFGPPHEIDYFTNKEMERYLKTFWDFHLQIENLDSAQLENVKSFIDYMLASENLELHNFALPLRQVCVNAAYYLIIEIKYRHIPQWTYDTKFDDSYISKEKEYNFTLKYYEDNSHGNPLHLYLAAVFFEENIKTVDNKKNKWNLKYNTFSFYERFMEKKMIQFQEKTKIKPDIMMTYHKEHADFILKYKKLAAYAIFNLQCELLFSLKDIKEIRETIRFIENGGEKTGLIYRVVNGIPIFIHMTFTEYLAVEYVCDCLKNENDSERMVSWMHFIFNVMFSMDNLMNIRNILDYRITIDETLMRILERNREVIFNLMMEQGRVYSNTRSTPTYEGNYWALSDALQQELHNFKTFFISMFECYLNESNLDEFLDIVEGSRLLLIARKQKSAVMIQFIIDIVRRIDESKLTSVLRDNFTFLTDSKISLCAALSSQDIVELLLEDYCLEQFDSTASYEPMVPDHSDWNMVYGISKRLYASSIPTGSSTASLSRPSSISNLASGALTSNQPRWLSTSNLPRELSTSDRSRLLSKSLPTFSSPSDHEVSPR